MDIFGMKRTQMKLEAAADAVLSGKKELNETINKVQEEAAKVLDDVQKKTAETQQTVKKAAKVAVIFEGIKCVCAVGILVGVVTTAAKK